LVIAAAGSCCCLGLDLRAGAGAGAGLVSNVDRRLGLNLCLNLGGGLANLTGVLLLLLTMTETMAVVVVAAQDLGDVIPAAASAAARLATTCNTFSTVAVIIMTSVTMMLGDAESRSVLGATCSSEEGEGWELGQELEGRAAGTVNIITSSSCATTGC